MAPHTLTHHPGLSGPLTTALCVQRPEQVQLIDDVCSSSEDGTVLTDGSGFIAPDLLARIPTGLYQGRPRPITTSASR